METQMNMHRSLIALLVAAPLAAQQPRAPQRVTFTEAITIALKQNISVRQAQNSAALSDASVSQAKQAFLPDLRLNVSGANSVPRATCARHARRRSAVSTQSRPIARIVVMPFAT